MLWIFYRHYKLSPHCGPVLFVRLWTIVALGTNKAGLGCADVIGGGCGGGATSAAGAPGPLSPAPRPMRAERRRTASLCTHRNKQTPPIFNFYSSARSWLASLLTDASFQRSHSRGVGRHSDGLRFKWHRERSKRPFYLHGLAFRLNHGTQESSRLTSRHLLSRYPADVVVLTRAIFWDINCEIVLFDYG